MRGELKLTQYSPNIKKCLYVPSALGSCCKSSHTILSVDLCQECHYVLLSGVLLIYTSHSMDLNKPATATTSAHSAMKSWRRNMNNLLFCKHMYAKVLHQLYKKNHAILIIN
jgi:hypothetical protein